MHWALFAEPMDPGLGSLIGNVGVIGVLIWYLWYSTTNSIPKLVDKFAAEQEKSRSACQEEQRQAIEVFRHEQDTLRALHAKETAELRTMLVQSMTAMRGAVHDVRDTANVVVQAVQVENEKQRKRDGGSSDSTQLPVVRPKG